MSAEVASVSDSPTKSDIEQPKPWRLAESDGDCYGLEDTIRSVDRLSVVCGCSQSPPEDRERSGSGGQQERHKEEINISSEEAIRGFLQASIDFEESQNGSTKQIEI